MIGIQNNHYSLNELEEGVWDMVCEVSPKEKGYKCAGGRSAVRGIVKRREMGRYRREFE